MKFLIVATVFVLGLATATSKLVDESEPAKATVKLLGGYQTRTRFSTVSSTTFKTCITVLGQNAKCQGRRKREAKTIGQNLMAAEEVREILLDSSEGEEKPVEAKNDNSGKLIVALSTFTTLTTTAYFDNTATTVSVSFHCIPPDGINYAFC